MKQRFPVSTYIGVVVVRVPGPELVRIGTVTIVEQTPQREDYVYSALAGVYWVCTHLASDLFTSRLCPKQDPTLGL